MISAIPPSGDDKQLYRRLSQERGGSDETLLISLEPSVFNRYHEYNIGLGLCTPATWGTLAKNVLESNWEALSRVAFSNIRPDIFATTSGYCYLCGNGRAGEIDHYLPRKKFPEYSALKLNLIPACHRCNNRKRMRYQIENKHLYFHPYTMTLPNEQFVAANVKITSTVEITFSIEKSATMTDAVYEVLTAHFSDLSLADTYQGEAIQHMVEQRNAYYSYHRYGSDKKLQEYLSTEAKSVSAARGKNHWKPVLLNALASSHGFCSGGFQKLGPETALED